MASVLLMPDNEGEDKHVESRLVPRLDESSNLSSSTKATDSFSGLFLSNFILSECMKKLLYILCAAIVSMGLSSCSVHQHAHKPPKPPKHHHKAPKPHKGPKSPKHKHDTYYRW